MKACTWLRIEDDHTFVCYVPDHANCLRDGECPIYREMVKEVRRIMLEKDL